jgi:hypothetical protein
MIIFCEECGEKYDIEIDETKGAPTILICSVCYDVIRIPAQKICSKPDEKAKSKTEKD